MIDTASSPTPRIGAGDRVLVTGAAGFIGSHLCRQLVATGAEVHAVSRHPRDDGDGITWSRADLADFDAAADLLGRVGPDYVFHLASHVAGSRDASLVVPTFRDNLTTTVALLLAVQEIGCRRFVLAGSLEEPAPGAGDAAPSSPYSAAKWAATSYARFFHAIYAVPAVVARIFMVYGPAQQDRRKLVPYTALSFLGGGAPELSAGTREVDWVYVEDVAAGLVALAVGNGLAGGTYDVGSGELVTVREVVERLHRITGATREPRFGSVADRKNEQVRVADVERTARETGWRPRVGLDEGLTRTVDWYRVHPEA